MRTRIIMDESIAMKFYSDQKRTFCFKVPFNGDMVLSYLRELINACLATDNQNEVVFKN